MLLSSMRDTRKCIDRSTNPHKRTKRTQQATHLIQTYEHALRIVEGAGTETIQASRSYSDANYRFRLKASRAARLLRTREGAGRNE